MQRILLCAVVCSLAYSLTVGTWNIGLEERLADERVDAIINAINKTNNTVLCLNEIWGGPSRIEYFSKHVNYKYKYSIIDQNIFNTSYVPACQDKDLLSVLENLDSCDNAYCLIGLVNIEQYSDCWACLVELAYKIYAKQSYNLLQCFEASQPWQQTLGLLLLSNVKLHNVTWNYLPTAIIPRGYISANLDDIHIVCTHLTVPTVTYPYPGIASYNIQSWQEENVLQSTILRNLVAGKRKVLLMGDFNHGGSNKYDITAIDNTAYEILANNLTDLYKTFCTACIDNTIVDMPYNVIYDHIYARNLKFTYVERYFDKRVMLGDGCAYVSMSDHYGLIASNETIVDIYDNKCYTSDGAVQYLISPLAYIITLALWWFNL